MQRSSSNAKNNEKKNEINWVKNDFQVLYLYDIINVL